MKRYTVRYATSRTAFCKGMYTAKQVYGIANERLIRKLARKAGYFVAKREVE